MILHSFFKLMNGFRLFLKFFLRIFRLLFVKTCLFSGFFLLFSEIQDCAFEDIYLIFLFFNACNFFLNVCLTNFQFCELNLHFIECFSFLL